MPSFDFFYLFFNFLLLWVMYYEGLRISKKGPYTECALWTIFTFVLVEGLRYARGVDYLHYLDVYNRDLEESQIGFTFINNVLKLIGFPAEFAFFFYAFFFIWGALVLLRPMRKYFAYVLPLFLISIISYHEAIIRQMLSMSFVFFYVSLLDEVLIRKTKTKVYKRDLLKLAAWAFIAYSVHSIAILAIFLITILMLFIRKPFSWKYTIPIFFLGKFIVSKAFDWSTLGPLFEILSSSDGKLGGYASKSEAFFSEDAEKDKYTQNIAIQFVGVIGICALFYQGERICNYLRLQEKRRQIIIDLNNWLNITKNNYLLNRILSTRKKKITIEYNRTSLYTVIFNSSVIGIIFLQTFFNLEILRRIALCWDFYWFVPMALILYYSRSKILFSNFDRLMMLGFFYWIWDYYRFLFSWKQTPQFLWDLYLNNM